MYMRVGAACAGGNKNLWSVPGCCPFCIHGMDGPVAAFVVMSLIRAHPHQRCMKATSQTCSYFAVFNINAYLQSVSLSSWKLVDTAASWGTCHSKSRQEGVWRN